MSSRVRQRQLRLMETGGVLTSGPPATVVVTTAALVVASAGGGGGASTTGAEGGETGAIGAGGGAGGHANPIAASKLAQLLHFSAGRLQLHFVEPALQSPATIAGSLEHFPAVAALPAAVSNVISHETVTQN